MLKNFLGSLIPWLIFFILFSYDQIHLAIGASGALIVLVILSRRGLAKGFLFDWGSLLFFVFILVTLLLFYETWIKNNADILANIALCIIAWGSLLIKRPFTFEYAKLSVAKEYWHSHLFTRINRYLTIIWASAFTLMTLSNGVGQFILKNNIFFNTILPALILMLTLGLSVWFPKWYKHKKLGAAGVITIEGLSDLIVVDMPQAIISYRTLGTGLPLILLPDVNMSMYGWDPILLEKLAKHYQLILIDYPGIGKSVNKITAADLAQVTHILQDFIDKLALKDVSLFGFAMGGFFAQRLAIQLNRRLKGLVLIATDAGGQQASHPEEDLLARISNTQGTLDQQQAHVMELLFPAPVIKSMHHKMHSLFRMAALVRSVPEGTVLAEKKLIAEWYSSGGTYRQLSSITVPTLIFTGTLDVITHRQNSIVLANGIQQAKLIEYPDAGHGLIYQYPERVAEEIVQYFKL